MIKKILKAIKNPGVIAYHIGSKMLVFKYRLNPSIHIGKNVIIEKNAVLSTLGGGQDLYRR